MQNSKIKFSLIIAIFSIISVFTSCKKDETKPVVIPPKDVVDVALSDAKFTTLTKLLTDNGLVTALKGAGPFTVFAPTNDAFAKIDASKLTKDELVAVLKAHVLGAKVLAADVTSGKAQSLSDPIYLSKNANGVYINGAIKVSQADVQASNGVIHVIDNVILPPSKSLVSIAGGNADFSELVSLVLKADPGVAKALTDASDKGFTVFAPTNAAFTELYKTVPKDTLLKASKKAFLTSVLLYHVVEGRVFSSDLPNVSGEVASANGKDKLTFDLASGAKVKGKSSGNSTITATNILATNGVIHVIDKVLLP
jgi:uncharacterized surface protein with fasciclin (FAS1) repeats